MKTSARRTYMSTRKPTIGNKTPASFQGLAGELLYVLLAARPEVFGITAMRDPLRSDSQVGVQFPGATSASAPTSSQAGRAMSADTQGKPAVALLRGRKTRQVPKSHQRNR